ncbi:hypothetical protein ACW4TU_41400 [Streptomyces sp. QTS52]
MNGPIDLRTAVMLLAGCGTTYMAFRYPTFGTALVVGIATITLLHILLEER